MKNLKVGLMVGLLMVGQGLIAENSLWSAADVTQTSKKILATEAALLLLVPGVIAATSTGFVTGAYSGSRSGASSQFNYVRSQFSKKIESSGVKINQECLKEISFKSPLSTAFELCDAAGGGVLGALSQAGNAIVNTPNDLHKATFPRILEYINKIDLKENLKSKNLQIDETEEAVAWFAAATTVTLCIYKVIQLLVVSRPK